MGQYRVWNKHAKGYTHREKFRDDLVEIPAGRYVLMDYEDAVLFKGQYFPLKRDAMGQEDPTTWKQIFIEPDDNVTSPIVSEKFVSHIDGKEFNTKAQLDSYLKANFAGQEFKDAALDEELSKIQSVKPEQTEKRRPGRPPKEKTL